MDFNGPKIQIKTFSFILVTQCGNNLCFEYNYSKLQSSTFFLIKIICVTFLGDIGKQYSWSVCSHSSAIMRLTLTNERKLLGQTFYICYKQKSPIQIYNMYGAIKITIFFKITVCFLHKFPFNKFNNTMVINQK